MYPEHILSHNWLIKKAVNNKVRARLPELSGRVIDLGCGVRPFEKDILEHADEYVGVDWGNTLHGLKADIVADLNRPLPIADETASHVVSFEVLEHLSEPQVTLSVPFQWWVHEAPWDYYRYTCHGLEYMLRKAGFTDVVVSPTTGFWSMWLLKFNYQTLRLARRGPRPVRLVMRTLLIPFWWLNQHLAQAIDRFWPEESETAGYFVTATKP